MFRGLSLVAGLALAAASVMYAQQPTTPPVPEDALSPRELVAWTSLQVPRPAQESLAPNPIPPYPTNQDSAHPPAQIINADWQREPAHVAQPLACDSRPRTR